MSSIYSCKKDWLDEKPNLSFVVPKDIADYQALLDNTTQETGSSSVGGSVAFNDNQINSNEMSADDFFVNDGVFDNAGADEQNIYIWGQDMYVGLSTGTEWNTIYKKIYYTNIILEGIEGIRPSNNGEQVAWDQVKGSALFFRAYNLFEATQLFCKPYIESSSQDDLGVPIRTSSDITIRSTRSSVKNCYDAILNDLKLAKNILPVSLPNSVLYKLRPTKNAATAMLARVYLSMAKYDSAFKYVNEALGQYNQLIDYNTDLNPVPYFIPKFNAEVIFHTTSYRFYLNSFPSRAIVSPDVYSLFDINDLRQTVFFYNFIAKRRFRGGYDNGAAFSGLATDEMYLIRAECLARSGSTIEALNDLNALVRKRWNNLVSYQEIGAANADEALSKILIERRKELYFRGTRWSDLRRLNREDRFAITLTRTVNGQTYTLPPNDNRYILPIPPDVIRETGIAQNPR